MHYEIDQSNKIEQTERDTVLAITNDLSLAIVLKSKDKRLLQQIFRDRGEPKVFIFFVFAALLAILLVEVSPESAVVVDHEYLNHEDLIKLKLKQFLTEHSRKELFDNLRFDSIGKKSNAHAFAAKVSFKKEQPQRFVSCKEILKWIGENKTTKNDRVSQTGPRTA